MISPETIRNLHQKLLFPNNSFSLSSILIKPLIFDWVYIYSEFKNLHFPTSLSNIDVVMWLKCWPMRYMDPTEAEDIKKRWQEYTELYKKDLHDLDNHDGMIIHLQQDILECTVKWVWGSITVYEQG